VLTVVKEQSPAKLAVEQTVETHPGARTMTVDPKTGHVLLIVADYGPAPEAPPAGAPAGPGGRFRPRPMIPGSFQVIEIGK
jgi:hypothetical protein